VQKTVSPVEAASGLPLRVQEALGELVEAAKEGLLALSVGVGLGVLSELMEEESAVETSANAAWCRSRRGRGQRAAEAARANARRRRVPPSGGR
jgi:hypothetical protein